MKEQLFTNKELQQIIDPVLSITQILLISEPTPECETETRIDENGNEYKIVRGSYVKKRLNLIFGFGHSFKIKSMEYIRESKEIIVEGKLTVKSNGIKTTREQIGKHRITIKNGKPIDIGNSYKAAATDCLKKCASEFGLFWDIYNNEPKQIEVSFPDNENQTIIKITERLDHFLKQQTNEEGLNHVFTQFKENNTVLQEHNILYEHYLKKL